MHVIKIFIFSHLIQFSKWSHWMNYFVTIKRSSATIFFQGIPPGGEGETKIEKYQHLYNT